MSKKTAILVAALLCFSVGIASGATTTPPKRVHSGVKAPARHSPAHRVTSNSKPSHLQTAKTATQPAKQPARARRSRARAYDPWRVSSFGNPTERDNPAGEDPAVRAVAVRALGNWNGAVVVVNPNNGRILSVVNQPLALSGAFTPCSTIKPVVAAGALKEGIITSETKLRVFGPHGGRITLRDALAHSNNMFFAKLGEMLGFKRVEEYAQEFGLGEKAGWDIPGESPGVFPSAPPKEGGVGLMTSFGSTIQITPLQQAAIASAIANGGTLYWLQYPRTPEEVESLEPRIRRRLDNLSDVLPGLKEGMAAAVLYGTARSAYNPLEAVYGKTGTCSQDGAHLGWFESYAADPESKYAVVVLLRGGRMMFGPHAAEIAGNIYRDLLDHDKMAAAVNRTALTIGLMQ
ncbi:MAG: penicillin-binding transpeptidase domain-containing protein [Terriglobia bacterium]